MIDPTMVSAINPIAIPSEALWFIFSIVVIFTIIMSVVLFYHWHKYGYGVVRMGLATTIYVTVAAILIGFIFSSISGYIVSL